MEIESFPPNKYPHSPPPLVLEPYMSETFDPRHSINYFTTSELAEKETESIDSGDWANMEIRTVGTAS